MKHASVDRAKRFDSSCRNHGSCPWCRRSRTIGAARMAEWVKLAEADVNPFTKNDFLAAREWDAHFRPND